MPGDGYWGPGELDLPGIEELTGPPGSASLDDVRDAVQAQLGGPAPPRRYPADRPDVSALRDELGLAP
jgi:hypothetical protein